MSGRHHVARPCPAAARQEHRWGPGATSDGGPRRQEALIPCASAMPALYLWLLYYTCMLLH